MVIESILNEILEDFGCQGFDSNRSDSNGFFVELSCIFELVPVIQIIFLSILV